MDTQPDNPFQIDDTNLVDECLKMASMSRAAGESEADAKHEYAMAVAQLDVITAQLRMKIRTMPKEFGYTCKLTADDVEAVVMLQPEHQSAVKRVNELKRNVDYTHANVTAHLDRRKMIERRIELLSMNYHSEREPAPVSAAGREYLQNKHRRSVRETETE